ncbi:MAG: hypothetical protein Q8R44_12645 [Novosphingobium sp.]|nr:hypothetical protein [Novosphingobium sp.]
MDKLRTIEQRSGAASYDQGHGVRQQAASQGATTQAGGADNSSQAQ